jgi:4-carboxymuconolactone decarboxylase
MQNDHHTICRFWPFSSTPSLDPSPPDTAQADWVDWEFSNRDKENILGSYETGLAARKKVLGAEYVDRAINGADSFNQEFQQMLTSWCWGEIWGRTTLSDKQRSLNNLCLLSAMNRPHEFKTHFRAALGNGCTLDELKDTLLQVAVYCGVPAGVEAFRLAREVMQEEGIAPEGIS